MKKKVCPTKEDIIRYLGRPVSSPTDEALERHLEICPGCRKIADGDVVIPDGALKLFSAVGKALTRERPAEFRFGQIWRVRGGKASDEGADDRGEYDRGDIDRGEDAPKAELGIVTAGTADSLYPDDPDVRLVPFRCGVPKDLCRQPDDVRLDGTDNDLCLSGVAETWNERPVLARNLEAFLGDVSPEGCKRIQKALTAAISPESSKAGDHQSEALRLTDRERLYRFSRIEEASILSKTYLDRLSGGVQADEAGEVNAEEPEKEKGDDEKPSDWREWVWQLVDPVIPAGRKFAFQAEGEETPFERFRKKFEKLCARSEVFLACNTLGEEEFVVTLTEDVPAKTLVFLKEGKELGSRKFSKGKIQFGPRKKFSDIGSFDEVRLR